MRCTAWWRQVANGGSGGAHSFDQVTGLLQRWRQLHDGPPMQVSGARRLLDETVVALRPPPRLGSHETAERTELPCTSPSDATLPSALSSFDDESGASRELLGHRAPSQMIWRTLQRQRIPWQEALQLVPFQLAVLSDEQRRFAGRQCQRWPWTVTQVMQRAWDYQDAPLRLVYHQLKQASTVVAFAQVVSAALRERPELHNVLPVPRGVLSRLYELGLREAKVTPTALRMTLELCKHVALLSEDSLPVRVKEHLTSTYATLHALNGDWDTALSVLTGSPAVRHARKASFQHYVKTLHASQNDETSTGGKGRATRRATLDDGGGSAAAETPLRPPATGTSTTVELREGQLITEATSGAGAAGAWESELAAFMALPPHQQRYGVLRPLLERLPDDTPEYMLIAAAALRHAGPRMYAGKLTRRVWSLQRQGQWKMAIALGCSAGYYDVVLPFCSQLSEQQRVRHALPADLVTYEKTVRAGTHPHSGAQEGKAAFTADVAQLSHATPPELLAHALYGDWVAVSGVPTALANPRLRSLLSARLQTTSPSLEQQENGGVQCYTFQDATFARLVCACASERDRAYFLQVIPAALRRHHCLPAASRLQKSAPTKGSPAAQGDTALTATAAFESFLSSSAAVSSVEECDTVFIRLLTQSVREQEAAGAGIATEQALLWQVARAAAAGKLLDIRLADRNAIAVAVLTAAAQLHLDLDAAATARTFTSIPSQFVDGHTDAVRAGVTALTLTGQWATAMKVYERWHRATHDDGVSKRVESGGVSSIRTSDSVAKSRAECAAACLSAVYSSPRPAARRFARRVWHLERDAFSLMVQDLLEGDARQACDLLIRARKAELHAPNATRKKANQRRRRETRRVLGACFCLLQNETSLRGVVHAYGKERVRVEDVDAHGLQRLLRVLPWETAVSASRELYEAGRTPDETWLALLMAKPSTPLEVVHEVGAWRPHSYVLCSTASCRVAMANGDPAVALKSLVRFQEVTGSGTGFVSSHYHTLALLLKQFSESEAIERALLGPSQASLSVREECAHLAKTLHNNLLHNAAFTEALKRGRPAVTQLLKRSEVLTSVLLVGYLHHVIARHLQLPVAASFTSHLLHRSVTPANDWRSALLFFARLRHPTVEERRQLVAALHPTIAAMPALLHSVRFLHDHPEQVVVWADPVLSNEEKWEMSLRLLAQAATDTEEVGQDGSTEPSAATETTETVMHTVNTLVPRWNWVECARGIELLRRTGHSVASSNGVGGAEDASPPPGGSVDAIRTAQIVRALQSQQRRCPPPPPETAQEVEKSPTRQIRERNSDSETERE